VTIFNKPLNKNPFFQYDTRIYFLVFLLANSVLAYAPINLVYKLWIGLFLLIFPLSLAILNSVPLENNTTGTYRQETFNIFPLWIIISICITAVLMRFFLVTLPERWPILDDSIVAYYALRLSQNWDWKFFFGSAQNPSLFFWSLALFYKIVNPSLFAVFLFPILVSLLIFIFSYFSFRTFFSTSFSLFGFFGMSLSFWIFYTQQFCTPAILFLFWDLMALAFLGWLINSKSASQRKLIAGILGLWSGFGFFVAISAPIVVFFIGLGVFFSFYTKNKKEIFYIFLLSASVLIFSFFYISIHEKYGAHIRYLWVFQTGIDWKKQFPESISNITALFWQNFSAGFGPTWGGMFNPVLSSLFFIGILECYRVKHLGFIRWLFVGLVLFLAPGFLSLDFEVFRLIAVFPILLIISGLGFQKLISESHNKIRISLISLIFIASLLLDFHHLQVQRSTTSPEAYVFSNAYKILKSTNQQLGPGAVLLDLRPNIWDKTLAIATYPFNASYNEKLDIQNAKWVAIIENEDYMPFLKVRFPDALWTELGPDSIWKSGQLVLCIIPVNQKHNLIFQHWINVDLYYKSAVDRILDAEPYITRENIFEILAQGKDIIKGDPFLESCYYEKLFFSLPSNNQKKALEILDNGLKKGYSLPFFIRVKDFLSNQVK
jgi:hypothetical protein